MEEYTLDEEPTSHQPIDPMSFFNDDYDNLNLPNDIPQAPYASSSFLYPEIKNLNVLCTDLQPLYFEWCNFKKCYSNLSINYDYNRLELRPILPWQLIQEQTFRTFREENEKNIFIVVRLGFEVCFGCVKSIEDIEEKIVLWLNHHMYETAFLVDIHDFEPVNKKEESECSAVYYLETMISLN